MQNITIETSSSFTLNSKKLTLTFINNKSGNVVATKILTAYLDSEGTWLSESNNCCDFYNKKKYFEFYEKILKNQNVTLFLNTTIGQISYIQYQSASKIVKFYMSDETNSMALYINCDEEFLDSLYTTLEKIDEFVEKSNKY